eukprot:14192122-Alexandrium_andersonii.AAC.1
MPKRKAATLDGATLDGGAPPPVQLRLAFPATAGVLRRWTASPEPETARASTDPRKERFALSQHVVAE